MVEKSLSAFVALVRASGHRMNNALQKLGFAARFFVMVLVYSGQSFRRFNLTIREIYFCGFQSLLIILVSGLFIGMVLGIAVRGIVGMCFVCLGTVMLCISMLLCVGMALTF